MPRRTEKCKWISESEAMRNFALFEGQTQSQRHIKPLHWYIACRLVLEGGIRPEHISPRPPFFVSEKRGKRLLHFNEASATGSEATVLGGLKTKNVDVVVSMQGIGPVLAVSCKGMTGALRNLVNRLEETIGECTNLHITYPALVFGYFFVIRSHHRSDLERAKFDDVSKQRIAFNNVVIEESGKPVESIQRFHSALCSLADRRGIRDELSKYEAVSLALIEPKGDRAGSYYSSFPPVNSPVHIGRFFPTLYEQYDERFVVSAPRLAYSTRRLEWSPESPALKNGTLSGLDYGIRLDS